MSVRIDPAIWRQLRERFPCEPSKIRPNHLSDEAPKATGLEAVDLADRGRRGGYAKAARDRRRYA